VGVGIAVLSVSIVVNLLVTRVLRARARATGSPALAADAAHLTADAITSAGVLCGLVLVAVTGWTWLDPVIALGVAAMILVAGIKIVARSSRALVDERLPEDELEVIRSAIESFAERGVAGYHALRTRRAGARRHVDVHLQFRAGTTLEHAHGTAHALQDEIRERLDDADILIHLEPEDRVRPGTELPRRRRRATRG
jgi:cation diffusion facilitator family transporter